MERTKLHRTPNLPRLVTFSMMLLVACAAPAAAEPAPPAQVSAADSRPSRFSMALDVSTGYGGYRYVPIMGSTQIGHGPTVDASLRLLWGLGEAQNVRVGLRLHGFVNPATQNRREDDTFRDEAAGAHLAAVIESRHLWGSVGFGFIRTFLGPSLTDDVSWSSNEGRSSWGEYLPELHLAGGVNIPLHRHLDLQLGAEVDTLLITLRYVGTAGLKIRF